MSKTLHKLPYVNGMDCWNVVFTLGSQEDLMLIHSNADMFEVHYKERYNQISEKYKDFINTDGSLDQELVNAQLRRYGFEDYNISGMNLTLREALEVFNTVTAELVFRLYLDEDYDHLVYVTDNRVFDTLPGLPDEHDISSHLSYISDMKAVTVYIRIR